jgi:hypothetical protein
MNPLAFLSSHFSAFESRRVEIPGFPFVLFYHPLTVEQTFGVVRARDARTVKEQVTGLAEVLVQSVHLEDGTLAFAMTPGGPNPVEVLTQKTDPAIFSALIQQLKSNTNEEEVNDVEKKSDSPEAASSSDSTSSPTDGESQSQT